MKNLEHLGSLYEDMKAQDWTTAGFCFTYKKIQYDVIVTRFVDIKRVNKYALVHLTIIKNRNLDNIFSVEANRNRFLCEISKIKDFF